jgi:hypothetical protein
MNPHRIATRVALGLVVAGACALGLAACGGTGPLAQPPPLFGAQARADYDAQKAAAARAAREQHQNAAQSNAIADQEDNTVADDQPKSTRDIPDPNQLMTNPRTAPVPGSNSMANPAVSVTPPN